MSQSPVVAVLGFGMAGRPIARGLAEEGLREVRVWKRPPWRTEHMEAADHEALHLTESLNEALQGADVVLSLLQADAATETARQAVPHLSPSAFYVDMNTTLPGQMTELNAVLEAAGVQAVDAAICDPAEIYGHRVRTLVSGPRASELRETMHPYGMRFEVLSERVGDASLLKVLRSIFTKGLMMTFLETIEAARRCDLVEPLLDSIAGTVEGLTLRELALSLAGTSLVAADRRLSEMEDVVTVLESMGVEPHISHASREKFRWLTQLRSRDAVGGLPPESMEDMLEKLAQIFETPAARERASSEPAWAVFPPKNS